MTPPKPRAGRLQFLLIAGVFFGPLLLAAWLYYQGGQLQPAGRSNHGALLEPIVNVSDELSAYAALDRQARVWLLLYANNEPCHDVCTDALYTMRQSRLMLGKEMHRLQRVFLRGDSLPDTVLLAEEHPGLITLEHGGLNGPLQKKIPADLPAGGFFLIDPLGNLVMYFRPDIEPSAMVDDIKRLLRLSRIG